MRGGRHPVARLREGAWDGRAPFPVRRLRGRSWNRRQAAIAARALGSTLKQGDCVLATTWPVAAKLAERCRRLEVPLLVVAHGSDVTRLGERAPEALLSLARWARFGAVSGFLAGVLEALGIAARVLPAPVRPAPVAGLAPERHELLVVARCTPLKGVDRALRLGKALGWPVSVVGDGPERRQLQALARQLGVQARFFGRQPRERMGEHYGRATCLVLLSRADDDGSGAEGLGLVVLEAAAHGLPAAVSPVGGLPEAVGPGLVFADADDAARSADQLRAYLADEGVGARQRAWLRKRHGPDKLVASLRAMAGRASP